MQNPTSNKFWELIDAVLLINLDQRPERWEQFQAESNRFVPVEKLHRVSAIWGREVPGYGCAPWFRGRKRDATWAARAGCVLSHRKALLKSREAGWKTVLILEDDAVFEPIFPEIGASLHDALLQYNDEWEICYLGFTDPRGPFRRLVEMGSHHSLNRVYGCNTAHAYLMKSGAREWILDQLPEERGVWRWLANNRAVDRWYMHTLGRHFGVVCVSPSFINQRPGYSDIVGHPTDYLSRGRHRLAVPPCRSRESVFRARLFVAQLCSGWQRAYDRSRGLVKRVRGF